MSLIRNMALREQTSLKRQKTAIGLKKILGQRIIGVVVARFYPDLADRLWQGARGSFVREGLDDHAWRLIEVPGCFELPLAALWLASKRQVAGVVCLGVVIRGETYHFNTVADNAAAGVREVALATKKPVIFGVLTTENRAQALARLRGRYHKGAQAAVALFKMLREQQALRTDRSLQ